MSYDSSTNPLYVIFAGLDEDTLPRWLDAARDRFAGRKYYPVLIGGDGPAPCLRFHSPCDAASEFVAKSTRRLFLVVPDRDNEALAAFVRAGLSPTFVETEKHTPDAWAALGAPQPGKRVA